MKKLFFYVILGIVFWSLWLIVTQDAWVVRQYKGLFENRVEQYQTYIEKLE